MTRTLILTAALLFAAFAVAQGPRFGEAPRSGMTARMQALELEQQGQHGPSQLGARMRGALHDTLGLSEAELHARKEAGASIGSIAEEEGITRATLRAAYLEARERAIAELLAADAINEVRADWMRERGPVVFESIVDRQGLGGGQHLTGEPLMAQRSEAPRGPQAQPRVRRHQMEPMQRGPHGQREP